MCVKIKNQNKEVSTHLSKEEITGGLSILCVAGKNEKIVYCWLTPLQSFLQRRICVEGGLCEPAIFISFCVV